MKKFFAVMFLLLVPGAVCATPATVDYILDGDTFAAYVNLEDGIQISVRVRIKNIDTPEIHGMCQAEIDQALKAKERLAVLAPVGGVVELSGIKDDKYLGRIDAYVAGADGRNIGDILIAEGLARPYSGGHRAGWCD